MSWSRADLADAFSDVGLWQPVIADVAFNASGQIAARGRVRAQDGLFLQGQIQATDYVLRFVTDELPGLNVDDTIDHAGIQYKVLNPPELSGSSGWFSTARVERLGRVYPKTAIDMDDVVASSPVYVSDVQGWIADVALDANRLVCNVNNGRVGYADNTIEEHGVSLLGFTVGSAIASAPVQVRNKGPLENTGWSWIPNRPIWLGQNGFATQAVIASPSKIVQRVAFAVSPTKIFIEIEPPVYLG